MDQIYLSGLDRSKIDCIYLNFLTHYILRDIKNGRKRRKGDLWRTPWRIQIL